MSLLIIAGSSRKASINRALQRRLAEVAEANGEQYYCYPLLNSMRHFIMAIMRKKMVCPVIFRNWRRQSGKPPKSS